MKHGKLFIISGPSGSGKTSLVTAAINDLQSSHSAYALKRVITYTTKSPRSNEVDGIDYHFITVEDFVHKIASGFFLEWSFDYGNYYGSSLLLVDEIHKGNSFVMIADRKGAQSLQRLAGPLNLAVIYIWIDVELKDLEQRLRYRNTDSLADIEKRLALADKEIRLEEAEPLFSYKIHNKNFKESLESLKGIILKNLLA